MLRSSREDDRRRLSPYDSSRERPYHNHQNVHRSDDRKLRSKEWNPNGEKHKYQREYEQKTVRTYRGRSKNEDYSYTQTQESCRHNRYGRDSEKQHAHRSPSQSDDKSLRQATSLSNSPCGKSKRMSGFDVAPFVTSALPGPSGNTGLHVLPCFSWT